MKRTIGGLLGSKQQATDLLGDLDEISKGKSLRAPIEDRNSQKRKGAEAVSDSPKSSVLLSEKESESPYAGERTERPNTQIESPLVDLKEEPIKSLLNEPVEESFKNPLTTPIKDSVRDTSSNTLKSPSKKTNTTSIESRNKAPIKETELSDYLIIKRSYDSCSNLSVIRYFDFSKSSASFKVMSYLVSILGPDLLTDVILHDDLAKKLKMTKGALKKHLFRLSEAGLIEYDTTESRKGRHGWARYKLSPKSLAFIPLKP